MKKLIDRMPLSYREALNESKSKYPSTFKPVFEELETKGFWPSLSYETIGILVSHLNLKGYDPCYISEVFDNY